jgi:cytochrome c-type biogenesis protein CcmH/NrfG
MSTIPVLFYFLGTATAVLAGVVLLQPERASLQPGMGRRLSAAALLLVPAALLLIFSGTRQHKGADEALVLPAVAPVTASTSGMKEDADWAMITHAFMGGPPPGGAASASAPPAAATGDASQRAQQSAAELQAVTRREPKNLEAWLALARAHRVAREFPEAATAYEAALKLDPKNADAWADYADALASANGRSLVGKPAVAIDHALRIDPNHMKGLWLGASLDLEQHHYAEALTRWQKLRSVLPEGSSDIAIIDANIAEARQLTGQVQQAAR